MQIKIREKISRESFSLLSAHFFLPASRCRKHLERPKPKRSVKKHFSHEAQHKNNFQSLFSRREEKSCGSWQKPEIVRVLFYFLLLLFFVVFWGTFFVFTGRCVNKQRIIAQKIVDFTDDVESARQPVSQFWRKRLFPAREWKSKANAADVTRLKCFAPIFRESFALAAASKTVQRKKRNQFRFHLFESENCADWWNVRVRTIENVTFELARRCLKLIVVTRGQRSSEFRRRQSAELEHRLKIEILIDQKQCTCQIHTM